MDKIVKKRKKIRGIEIMKVIDRKEVQVRKQTKTICPNVVFFVLFCFSSGKFGGVALTHSIFPSTH